MTSPKKHNVSNLPFFLPFFLPALRCYFAVPSPEMREIKLISISDLPKFCVAGRGLADGP